eukprot:2336823-Pyramimonas_sp.AAC.1
MAALVGDNDPYTGNVQEGGGLASTTSDGSCGYPARSSSALCLAARKSASALTAPDWSTAVSAL